MNRLWFLLVLLSAMVFTAVACGSETTPIEETEVAPVTEDARSARRPSVAKTTTGRGPAPTTAAGEAVFADELIEKTIRLKLNRSEGPILVSDLEQITTFSMALRLYVADLSGIENLSNLTEFDLTQNVTVDISPLASLPKLTRLNLTQNDISDVSALAGLTNLTFLWLQDNVVNDISALAGLTNLTVLNLQENEIGDISALAGLTNLVQLNITSNNISDLSPLASLSNLKLLEMSKNQITDISPLLDAGLGEGTVIRLWGSPLDAQSIDQVIPQLKAAGVDVQF